MSEFPRALDNYENRLREAHIQEMTATILPFSGGGK
jgi:hypothetical protein